MKQPWGKSPRDQEGPKVALRGGGAAGQQLSRGGWSFDQDELQR